MSLDLNAGRLPDDSTLTNIPRLISRYYSERPEPSDPAQQVAFGTSGHRGSSLKNSFNEWHILAVTQAICDYRREQGIDGPLFVGMDTHALSEPAFVSALEVLAARRRRDAYRLWLQRNQWRTWLHADPSNLPCDSRLQPWS